MRLWVYTVAFRRDVDPLVAPFVMVRSRKRGGWEMPGGSIEDGEDPLEAARREFGEETGLEVEINEEGVRKYQDGWVFYGTIDGVIPRAVENDEILEVGTFETLPTDLAFPFVEYDPLIAEGRGYLRNRIV
jgi:8-oxo-dGTP pyrophosphatase MutT (NUDIX family)